MDDVRTLANVERRRHWAWKQVLLLRARLRFGALSPRMLLLSATAEALVMHLRDLHATLEVERMWNEACPTPIAAPSTAGEEVGAAPGGDRA